MKRWFTAVLFKKKLQSHSRALIRTTETSLNKENVKNCHKIKQNAVLLFSRVNSLKFFTNRHNLYACIVFNAKTERRKDERRKKGIER